MSKKTPPDGPPLPGGTDEPGFSDQRKRFEGLADGAIPNLDAERAFLESKMEMVANDPALNPERRERALTELKARIDSLTPADKK